MVISNDWFYLQVGVVSKSKKWSQGSNKDDNGIVCYPSQHGCQCRHQTKIFNFDKNVQDLNFGFHVSIKLEKCIKMSTNKPSIGTVVHEIVS